MPYTLMLTGHDDLKKEIKAIDVNEFVRKAVKQLLVWRKMRWDRCSEKRAEENFGSFTLKDEKDFVKSIVEMINKELASRIKAVDNILIEGLREKVPIDIRRSQKDFSEFNELAPQFPLLAELPVEPKATDDRYVPRIGFMGRLFKYYRDRKYAIAKNKFQNDLRNWKDLCETIKDDNRVPLEFYQKEYSEWERRKNAFLTKQKEHNNKIEKQISDYFEMKDEEGLKWFSYILDESKYPIEFIRGFQFDYNKESKMLVLDYLLPSPEDSPNTKAVKFVQARDIVEEVLLSESEKSKIYDNMLYQITLRTIYELFKADQKSNVEGIVFNGYVNSIDRGTGREVKACILSIQTNRKEFLEINLDKVEPKTCFKTLKGVGSSKLHSLASIAPILKIDHEDKRFVNSYAVANELNDSTNLAAMDWEDFEHLIREIFEKEFSVTGGEVKVTQASRDGGVDAIAFDPDPIRGGKIVIQAKRYINVVGVSAVRDLYGTVINEGATKGILVTTADYGSDAYEFIKGKPLTLLNGSNLLHLLQKHGHRAHINIKEAKIILAESEEDKNK